LKKKLFTLMVLAVAALFVLSACSDDNGENGDENEATGSQEETPAEMQQEEMDLEGFEDSDTFLRINGEEVTFGEYQQEFERSKEMAEMQYGIDFDDEDAAMVLPQLQQQAVESLITEHVMFQEARDQGIEVSDDEVEENIEALKEQFDGEEGLAEAMEAEGLTDESLREYLRENMMIENLLSRNLDLDNIEVTEEEKEDYYAQLQENWEEQGQEEVSFEEVEPQITQQLQQQKVQEKQMSYIQELIAESEIERMYQ
jgi:hypothetical protein